MVLDSRKIPANELQCLLNGWNACIKVPSIETTSPPPYQDLALEKRVLAEDSRKFGVKFSIFRKKLNIYSYVPGDSDHHPCMMQSTIRGELTKSLPKQTLQSTAVSRKSNSSGCEWTRRGHDGREFDRIAKCYPWRRQENAGRSPKRDKRSPSRTKYNIPGFCDISLFEESSTSM